MVKMADCYTSLAENFDYASRLPTLHMEEKSTQGDRLGQVYKYMVTMFNEWVVNFKQNEHAFDTILASSNKNSLLMFSGIHDVAFFDQLLKMRSDLVKDQIADLKKYSVENDLDSVKQMFEAPHELLDSTEKHAKDKLKRRETVIVNLSLKIEKEYSEICQKNTKHSLTELCKFFFLLDQNSQKV